MSTHTILLTAMASRIIIVNDCCLDNMRFRLKLSTRRKVHVRPTGTSSYLVNIRAPSLLVLLHVDVAVTSVNVLYLDVVFLPYFEAAHFTGPLANVGLHDLRDRLYILTDFDLRVLLLPLSGQVIYGGVIQAHLRGLLYDVFIRRQKVSVVVPHRIASFGVIFEAPKQGVDLVHVSFLEGLLEQFQDGYGYLKKVTAAKGEEVVPDAQDQTKGH
jgi:hypothetical protein